MSAPAVADAPRPFGEAAFEDGRSVLSPLRATLILLWLAAKRNGGFMVLPVIAGVMGWLVYTEHSWRAVILWMPTVQGIGYTLVVAGPLTAALACWVAGASRRRKMTEMLATVPQPSGWRMVADWLGVTVWAVGCYLVSAAVALGWTATQATWGGPLLWPIGIAAAGLAICAALGLLLGTLWPSRFLPPLVAMGVGFLLVAPTGFPQLDRVKMLSPLGPIDSVVREPLMVVDQRMMMPHLRWLAALGFVLVLTLIVRQGGGKLARGLLAAGVVTAVVTANPLLDYVDKNWGESGYFYPSESLPFEPICTTEAVTVCIHPAFTVLQDQTVDAIALILRPLAGIDGLPTRYEQTIWGRPSESGVEFSIYDGGDLGIGWDLAHQIPQNLVYDWEEMSTRVNDQGFGGGQVASQAIVATWLLQEYQQAAGLTDKPLYYGYAPDGEGSLVHAGSVAEGEQFHLCQPDPQYPGSSTCTYDDAGAAPLQAKIDAASERFLALDAATRLAWLEANWDDLRAGRVLLEQMP